MSLYGAVRRVYTAVLPQKVRHSIYMAFPAPLKKAKWKMLRVFGRVASHEEIYNAEYYATIVEPGMQISVKAISSSILETYRPRRVVDVGCGTGLLMSVLKDQGVDVEGMEYAEAACKTCSERGLKVHRVNLEKDAIPQLKADVVVSTEVAEHLPVTCADRFVDVLCGISDTVVMTAATPGQGGTDHVNEQPHEYWISKFKGRGFEFDEPKTLQWRKQWKDAGAEGCYWHNLMLFQRGK
jgi:hypothetical protein